MHGTNIVQYIECRRTLELAGPAFMKWGQWASTRADIFPPDMCNELAKLQSSAPAHSYRRTTAIVESALGQTISLLFDRCFGCASAAWV
jgi:aarF domain-containing kinase